MKKLARSVVGEVVEPFFIETLAIQIKEVCPKFTSVKEMGNYKALITIESKEEVCKILQGDGGPLSNFFQDIRQRKIEKVCKNQRLWIECKGIYTSSIFCRAKLPQ